MVLPFAFAPRLMVIAGLEFITASINNIPAGDGISSSLSPATIATGVRPPNLAHFKLSFRDYVELHVDHQPYNSMKPRTVPCIALRPVGNSQGSFYFMDLHSGRRRIGRTWTALPWTTEVIAAVETMAINENQPRMHNSPLFEFDPDIPVEDSANDDIPDVYFVDPSDDTSVATQPVPLFPAVDVQDDHFTDT